MKKMYISLVESLNEDIDDLRFVGASGCAANPMKVFILTVFVEIEIHVMDVVVHGVVLSWVERGPIYAEGLFRYVEQGGSGRFE